MCVFSSRLAQQRNLLHCLKWVGLRGLLVLSLFGWRMIESSDWSWAAAEAAPRRETIVLLHGMGRSRASMLILQRRLRAAGYETLNFPYRTAGPTLDEISEDLRKYITDNLRTERYHLVTHSLGAVIVRNAFKKELPPGLGRIVMLAPPNQPPELARVFRGNLVYKWITGETGHRLSCTGFYETLPTPGVEFGVIAGTRGQRVTFDGPNDGIVTVAGTRLDGMADFIELKHTHTLIMNGRDTAEAIAHFLQTGRFGREDQ